MNKEFTEKLTLCITDCKKVVFEVKQKKVEQKRMSDELAKRKEEELKNQKIMDIIGDLPSKLMEAANEGKNWVDIELPQGDFERGLLGKTGSVIALEYLKSVGGLSVEFKSRQEEERGAYNERDVWTVYFLRIMF